MNLSRTLAAELERHPGARTRRAASRGFSLIEVMIALVISGLVLVGVFAFSGVTRATAADFRREVRIQQSLEGAMATLGADLRLAGLGFAQNCDELRIYHRESGQLLNPGAHNSPRITQGRIPVDHDTEEAFWVLRDGTQAAWRSANTGVNASSMLMDPNRPRSGSPLNYADSVDVILGEPGYVSAMGAFKLSADVKFSGAGLEALEIELPKTSANKMNAGNPTDLAAVRQLFFPGSFVLIASESSVSNQVVDGAGGRQQCALLQVTDDVRESVFGGGDLMIPTETQRSGFNHADALIRPGGTFDPSQAELHLEGALVVPLGRLRWSRYEIDYTVPDRPYLVRRDLIGWHESDPTDAPSDEYPACSGAAVGANKLCYIPQLHVGLQGAPGNFTLAPRTPVAPMVEDMQVAVGCDGYVEVETSPGKTSSAYLGMIDPGAREGLPSDNQPNTRIDEFVRTDQRNMDEWLGNSLGEDIAPDCVYWGTGEVFETEWDQNPFPSERPGTGNFKMSPQAVRVTLLGKVENVAGGSRQYSQGSQGVLADDYFNLLYSIEDRPDMKSVAPGREYQTLTETFHLKNTKYRNPAEP